MSAVVSDTTSLIALAEGRLGLLGTCFKQVLLPDAVYAEWLAGDPTVAQRVQDCAFLRVETVTDALLLAELELLLDRGEAAALTLAKTRGLPLLVDEKKGRAVARMMGIPVLGLVGLLILAVERKHLPVAEAEQILAGARAQGFRVGDHLVESFRTRLTFPTDRNPLTSVTPLRRNARAGPRPQHPRPPGRRGRPGRVARGPVWTPIGRLGSG